MVVLVQSWGSIWQERGCRVWNTTGVSTNDRAVPRSKVFGQIAFGRRARLELSRGLPIAPSLWTAMPLVVRESARQLQLITHPRRGTTPDAVLVTITERLVGRLTTESWDRAQTEIVSFSEFRDRQEAMLLMRPFGWLRGSNATAVLLLDGQSSTKWSIKM